MVQLSIFDVGEETVKQPKQVIEKVSKVIEPIYEVGNRVRIRTAKELESPDIETVAYLTEYKFGGKVGTIKRVQVGTERVSYEVETSLGNACVTEEEIAFIS
ncbi:MULTISPECIES: hypothetical protein [Bacillus]|uniref:hypothetical protein n=1 Tax=Bacillus TaxID=1386 RepID=UPI00129E4FFD|nr:MULTISPECIES: hypothetical protein [Bacillus]MCY7796984.1 hypothetical protein [Bacillus spizizenii]MCY8439124.1 hypothetical protein [Bacillus haynesii]MCY8747326.1 hypothetical protein [Bacillus spizizenii]MCY8803723.1 hypothetical protein [Bacillus spizizenii]MCY8880738.1 hypothetical protein [Bacillus spizizenii]